ncbi:hypothetical protein B0H16DRAFT_1700133 [Mycena metata]|uniref:Uncharacterized protein n=1 Tax=Mycena metata TaxID=1033252 RepID=A0AAD7HGA2_9AGAR|nr:hypothetical protein B0H16DRAFT_1700133 [Mycena metata]
MLQDPSFEGNLSQNVDVFKINMYGHDLACGYGEGEDGMGREGKGGEGRMGGREGRGEEGRREGVGVSGYVGAAGIGPRKLSPHVCVGAGTHTTNARQRHLHACGVRAERGCECAPKNWHPVSSPACMCGRGDSTRTTNARSNVRTHTEFASAGASARKPHPVHGAGCTPLGVGASTDAGVLREGGSEKKGGKEGGDRGRWDEGVCDGNGEERMRWGDGMRRELRAGCTMTRRGAGVQIEGRGGGEDGDDDAVREGVCDVRWERRGNEGKGWGWEMGWEPRYGSGIPTRRCSGGKAGARTRRRECQRATLGHRQWGKGGWEEDAGEGNAPRERSEIRIMAVMRAVRLWVGQGRGKAAQGTEHESIHKAVAHAMRIARWQEQEAALEGLGTAASTADALRGGRTAPFDTSVLLYFFGPVVVVARKWLPLTECRAGCTQN